MKNRRTWLIGGCLLLLAGQAQAQDKAASCDAYARAAIEQNAANLQGNCGFHGSRWSSDYDHHYNWCRRVSEQQAAGEAQTRTEALEKQCSLPVVAEPSLLLVEPVVADQAAFCDDYARTAVAQQEANEQRSCGFEGPRWSNDYQGHRDWCLRVEEAQAMVEQEGRETVLQDNACAIAEWQPPGSVVDQEPPPAMVPPEQIWKPIVVTAGDQPSAIGGNGLVDAATFVKVTRWEVNACGNEVRLHIDRSGNTWKGDVSANLFRRDNLGYYNFGSGAFTSKPITTVRVYGLEPGMRGPVGVIPLKLVLKLRGPDQKIFDAGNPPYYLSLRRYRQPEITSIVPNQMLPGTTALVTVTGKDFVTPGERTTVEVLGSGVTKLPAKVVSVSPTVVKVQVTVPQGAAARGYWLRVVKQCTSTVTYPNFTVLKKPGTPPTPPPTPSPPAAKETKVFVKLRRHPAPPAGGTIPYAGRIYPVSGAVLQSITNGYIHMGKQWGIRIVKPGYTTNDCNKQKAVIDLPPGKTTTDVKGTPLGSGMPIAACIYPVSVAPSVSIPDFIDLTVRYTK